ncbi:MAG: MATE family efflux transporter [Pseudomonadales bacterium]|nr:MATE family efflux transporter [Pseudomonadales bacterium]
MQIAHIPLHCRRILALAMPIFIAQLSFMAMGFVDTLMAGRYAELDLAAVGFGSSITIPIMFFGQALLFSITAKAAPFWGSTHYYQAGRVLLNGILLAIISGILLAGLLLLIRQQLALFAVPAAVIEIAAEYQLYIAIALPITGLYQAFRAYIETTGQTTAIMLINLAGLLINIPLNVIFINGYFGAPEMGGAGCGLATLISFSLMLLLAALFVRNNHRCRQGFGQTHAHMTASSATTEFHSVKLGNLVQLLKLGLPIAITMSLEVGLFTVITLLIAPLGVTAIASHQIALSLSSLIFMLPYSQATALTIYIGHMLGEVKQGIVGKQVLTEAVQSGLIMAVVLSVLSSSMIMLFNYPLAGLYSDDQLLITAAASLVFISAIYQIPDAIQVCCNGILRAFEIVKRPVVFSFVAYWLIAVPCGYWLSFHGLGSLLEPLGTQGFWYALVLGLSLNAMALLLLLASSLKRYSAASLV